MKMGCELINRNTKFLRNEKTQLFDKALAFLISNGLVIKSHVTPILENADTKELIFPVP